MASRCAVGLVVTLEAPSMRKHTADDNGIGELLEASFLGDSTVYRVLERARDAAR